VVEISVCVTTHPRAGQSPQDLCRHMRVFRNSSLFFCIINYFRYLGWYSEFHNEWDPVKETSKLFHLVGLADYNDALASSNPLAYTIVLRIETYEKESLCKNSFVN
jgi:hypothetical protein